MSVDREMGKQNKICPSPGTLFSLQQEGHSDTCYNMDEP